MQQGALRARADLTFSAAVYRPEHAGHNNVNDVARLANYLGNGPARGLDDQVGLDGPPEALRGRGSGPTNWPACLREWFRPLADFYRRSHEAGRVVVIESVY